MTATAVIAVIVTDNEKTTMMDGWMDGWMDGKDKIRWRG
jgi:hypothetical protein